MRLAESVVILTGASGGIGPWSWLNSSVLPVPRCWPSVGIWASWLA